MKVKTVKYTGTNDLMVEFGRTVVKHNNRVLVPNVDYKETDSDTIELSRGLNPMTPATQAIYDRFTEDCTMEQDGTTFNLDPEEFADWLLSCKQEILELFEEESNE